MYLNFETMRKNNNNNQLAYLPEQPSTDAETKNNSNKSVAR